MIIHISLTFLIIIISLFLYTGKTQGNSIQNERDATDTNLNHSQIYSDYQQFENFDPNLILNRSFNEIRKRRSKNKRQNASAASHIPKSARDSKNIIFTTPANQQTRSKNNKDVRIYETFEEIHEHVNEPDDHDPDTQPSNHHKSHDVGGVEISEKKKHNIPIKIKVKHHHHHHHHNHIKEVIKTVPKPYPVEKIVHIPIEKIVEKIVQVPKIVNVTVEKIIHVPIEKVIEKIVRVPKPVHIPKPYVVEKITEKIVHVPKPYPVLKTVPYPVEIKVPVTVEKKIPVPYTVEVERKVPVYIRSQEPYKFEQRSNNFDEKHTHFKETSNSPVYSYENYNNNHKLSQSKQMDLPTSTQYHTYNEAIDQHPANIDSSQHIRQMEQSTAESTLLPIKFLETKTPFNLFVANNDTSFDVNPQTFANKLQELPFSFPIEFIQVHPMPFQNPIRLESSVSQQSLKNT
ncbi:PREDICTED: uncharacterized protein LOC108620429 [Drosophila arizonae]|uniref:Uncharacterized protein LOC108620429 n=1 Tax=Drosophila arizonae TaxID=7263 RepID=A0ABM1Q039_DROAR|nr:PREDICTED: uncharacterized protein LOC108620429 [Drosophila arizonae]